MRRWTIRLLLLLVFLEAGLFLAGRLWGLTTRAAPAPDGDLVVLCVGDSWTEGNSAGGGGGYPPRLEAALRAAGVRATVVNAGRSGSNSTQVLAALREGIARHRPKAVLILAGNNDHWNVEGSDAARYAGWRGRLRAAALSFRTVRLALLLAGRAPWTASAAPDPDGRTRGVLPYDAHWWLLTENLTTMARETRAAGAVAIFGTYFHMHGWRVNEIVRAVAAAEGAGLADHNVRFQRLSIEAMGRLLVPDGHPNAGGYDLMTEEWLRALAEAGLFRVE